MRKFIIIVLALIAICAGISVYLYAASFPTVSYRYRLTVLVEVDGQVFSGSSVIGVWYRFNPRPLWSAFGVFHEEVSGQAALIDLGARGVLVAALGGPDRCDVSAGHLFGRAYAPAATRRPCEWGYATSPENERALADRTGQIDLTPDNLPTFIWFANKGDANSAHFLKPSEFAAVIGDSVRLVSAQVEITHDPVIINIDKSLPLYKSLPSPPRGNSLELANGRYLNWGMFIAPGSI